MPSLKAAHGAAKLLHTLPSPSFLLTNTTDTGISFRPLFIMAGNIKYHAAPQRDSLEEQHYSQAPPSYEAEASTQAALLGGVPRSEDDNIPDDFKVFRGFKNILNALQVRAWMANLLYSSVGSSQKLL